jgi:hypothetical protein
METSLSYIPRRLVSSDQFKKLISLTFTLDQSGPKPGSVELMPQALTWISTATTGLEHPAYPRILPATVLVSLGTCLINGTEHVWRLEVQFLPIASNNDHVRVNGSPCHGDTVEESGYVRTCSKRHISRSPCALCSLGTVATYLEFDTLRMVL